MIKGARSIVVDGKTYQWIFWGPDRFGILIRPVRRGPARSLHVHIQLKVKPQSREDAFNLGVEFVPIEYPTPGDIAQIIHEGLEQGWDPDSKGPNWSPPKTIELRDYWAFSGDNPCV